MSSIDRTMPWESWRSVRKQAMKQGATFFLLKPEVETIILSAKTWERHMLFSILWKTGIKIHEALDLRVEDCAVDYKSVMFRIRSSNSGEIKRRGLSDRDLKVFCDVFASDYKRFINSVRIKPQSYLFKASRQTAHRWLTETVTDVQSQGISLPGTVTLDTLRHSAAIHIMISGMSMMKLKEFLGYQKLESTRPYEIIFEMSQESIAERIV